MAHPLDKVVQHIRNVAASQGATDGELLQSFVTSNDQTAFAALVRRHGPLVVAVCKRILGCLEDAEDAFQATFVILARKAAKLPQRCSLSTWLYGVAYRVALNARRVSERRRRHERQVKAMVSTNPSWDAAWREVQVLLDEEIQRLPERYRTPFILCCLERQTYVAAAQRIGMTETAVRNRLAEARKRLQARLSRRGVELTAVLGAAALVPGAATAQVAPALVAKAVSAATSAAVPASVSALVKGLTASLAIKKAKVGAVLFVVFSGLVGTASMWAVQKEPGHQEKPPSVQGGSKPEAPVKAEQTVTRDIYGDLLPPGALARLGSARFRYAGWLSDITFSSDGKRLTTAGSDGVRIWDSATGRPIHAFGDGASAVAFLDGGKRIATAGRGLAVWDLDPAKQTSVVPLNLNVAYIPPSAFSPDGKIWAGVTGDGSFNLLEVASGKLIHKLEGHPYQISEDGLRYPVEIGRVRFSPDGKVVAFACANEGVLLWESATGKMLHALSGHRPCAIAFSPDGNMVATGGEEQIIRVWETSTGAKLQELRGAAWLISGLAFAPDGRNLASVSNGAPLNPGVFKLPGVDVLGTTHLWDLKTGKRRMLKGLENGASQIAFSPDGTTLAAGGGLVSTVHLINIVKGEESATQPGHQGGILCVALSPDGKTLVSGGRDDIIHVWDLKTNREKARLASHEGHVSGLAFISDGRELASSSYDGWVRVWDWQNGQEIRRFANVGGWHHRFDVSSDGKTVLIQGGGLWDLATGLKTGVVSHPGLREAQSGLAGVFSPDGRKIGVLGRQTAVVDVKSGKEICQFAGHEPVLNDLELSGVFVNCLAFSPDGRLAATGGNDGLAFIWDTANGRLYRRLQGRENPVTTIAFSPDGRMVAVGSGTNRFDKTHKETVRLWEVATGKERRRFEGHRAQVTSIVFSRDGNTIFSGSEDGTVLVWDVTCASMAPIVDVESPAALWKALRSDDAGLAYNAMCALRERRDVTVLANALQPVLAPDTAKVTRLVIDLADNRYETRNEAERQLIELGELAAPELRKTLAGNTSLELRRRIELLITRLTTGIPPTGKLPTLRGIEVLERIGSSDAQAVLRTLAGGAPGARETEEAKASLERLGQRTSKVR